MFQGLKRGAVVLAGAALVLGFGGGYLAAKVSPASSSHGTGAQGGFAWPFFGHPRAANAARAGVAKPEGFTVWTTRMDTSGPDPRACARMTRPLDPTRSYADFVMVDPTLGHPPAVSVRDDELCVAGLGYSGHQLTLLKGLPAKTGETLGDNLPVDFSGADKPPAVAFDGVGVILPRTEADGVGIDTINVSRLHVEVWRVADRNLVRHALEAPDPTAEGEYSYDNDWQDDARKVWDGDVDVHAPGGQRAVTVFPLGAVLKEMKPGAYVLTASDASGVLGAKTDKDNQDNPARARRWVVYTDMGLATYDGADALDVVVRSLQTARPMAGVRLALVAHDGDELASASSDADGHVRFAHALLDGEGAAKAERVMAYGPNADFTLLDLTRAPIDLSSHIKGDPGRRLPGLLAAKGRAAAGAVDGFLYTDRGIYRPGETVHLVALVRDNLSHAVKDRPGALVIRRPSGTEFRRIRFDTTPDGAIAEDIVLPASAPRGGWRATLEMDGADQNSGQVSFEVQDFAPQRLAVSVTGDAGRPVTAGEQRKIAVNARFLYGAPGAGLQAQVEAKIAPDPDPFPQYKDYRWGDEATAFDGKLVQLPETTTDGAGNTSATLDTSQVASAVQPLSADVTATVLEPGGRPVTEGLTLKLRPRPLYFGVNIVQGSLGEEQTQTYQVIAVNAAGQRVAAQPTYTLISETWTYDWFEKDGRWGFHRTERDSVIAHGALAVGQGAPGRLTRRLPWGDYRLELTDAASGAKTVIRQSSGWSDSAKDEDAPDAARLSVGDKPYATGDTVELHIQAPFAGEAEIAVASDRVIALKTLSVPAGGTTVRLHADPAWGGGAYLLVSVMQPRNPTTAPKPRRALGLVYVPLTPKGRTLSVALGAPAKLGSHVAITVPVQVKGLGFGARAHVTLAAVDEGILRITHMKSPDPVAWYFGKRALAVDYRDDYGRLLNPNLGAPAALNYGGDEGGGPGLSATPIKTVALWSGVVETGPDGRAVIHLPPGDYNGQLRLMAVAWTDSQVGAGEQSVLVREPVVAELDLPRFLAPGDRADIGLELHNVEGKVGGYLAEVFGQGGLVAPFQKLYQLVLGQRVLDHASLTAPNRPGVGAVVLKVSGPGFAETTSYPLQTRMGWSAITRATSALQQPGEAFTPTPPLLAGLSPGALSMTVSYSPFRNFDPAPIAEALERYPYGCTEQIVSAAYPLLYAQEVSSSQKLKRVPSTLTGTVIKLLDREGEDGAFGLWRPGDAEADPWLGAYTVDFLLQAQKQGAAVPADALQRALSAMHKLSQPDSSPNIDYRLGYQDFWGKDAPRLTKLMRSRAAAYALYDLAEAHQGDLPRLRWFHDVQFADEPSPLARAQVGAALALMGDRGRAHDSFVQAVRALGYREPSDWYQSPLRDTAGVIALAYEAGETGIARSLQTQLENTVKSPDDLNTQEQAELLKAAHAMLAAAGPISIQATGVRPLGGAKWAVGRLADARFVNVGRGALWRTVTVHGLPSAAPAAAGNGLTLEKAFFSLDGRPLDPAHMVQGQQVIVRLKGVSQQGQAMMTVVDDALPAGFEIDSTLSPEDADTTRTGDGAPSPGEPAKPKGPYAFLGVLTKPSVQEKRDDRYVAALTVPGQQGFALAYIARAVTPGDFFLPGAAAGDMYRPAVAARTAAGRVTITTAH